MTLEDLKKQVARDVKIDEANLDRTAVNIPMLYVKYLDLLHKSQLKCAKLKGDYDLIYRQKFLHYRNDHNVIFKNRGEIEIMIDGDGELQESRMKLDYEKRKAEYLETVLKIISGLSFNIRDAIEWRKFQAGAY